MGKEIAIKGDFGKWDFGRTGFWEKEIWKNWNLGKMGFGEKRILGEQASI